MEYNHDIVDEMGIRAMEAEMFDNDEELVVTFADGKQTEVTGAKWSFEQLVERMHEVNRDKSRTRVVSVRKGLYTYCAPMENDKVPNIGIKGRGRLADIYLIPSAS